MIRQSIHLVALSLVVGCGLATQGVAHPVLDPSAGDSGGEPMAQTGTTPDAGVTDALARTDGGAPERAPDGGPAPGSDGGPPRGDAMDAMSMPTPTPGGWVGPPVIVGVGQGGRRIVSVDGIKWTGDTQDVAGAADPTRDLKAVAYGNGMVVAVGGGCVGTRCAGRLTTFNGAAWTDVALPASQSWLGGVAFSTSGTWVAVGAAGPILVSQDGKRWTQKWNAPANLRAVAHGSIGGVAMFVCVGENGLRATSVDGQTWTNLVQAPLPGGYTPVNFTGVVVGDDTAVATGGGRLIRSLNGIAWTNPSAGETIPDLPSLVYADMKFAAYRPTVDNAYFLSSDRGASWLYATVLGAPGNAITTGALKGVRLYVGATGAAIATSPDGQSWTTRLPALPGANTWAAFAFATY